MSLGQHGEISTGAATSADVDHVAARMRPSDRAEVAALGLAQEGLLLRQAFARSVWSEAIRIDGVAAALYGLGRDPLDVGDSIGMPWLLGTPAVDHFGCGFIRRCVSMVDRMLLDRSALVNLVHGRNKKAMRWIAWLGFEIEEPLVVPATGESFHPFWIARPGHAWLASSYIAEVRRALTPASSMAHRVAASKITKLDRSKQMRRRRDKQEN